jgi:hypothetical protein
MEGSTDPQKKLRTRVIDIINDLQKGTENFIAMSHGDIFEITADFFKGKSLERNNEHIATWDGHVYVFANKETLDKLFPALTLDQVDIPVTTDLPEVLQPQSEDKAEDTDDDSSNFGSEILGSEWDTSEDEELPKENDEILLEDPPSKDQGKEEVL